MNKKGFTLVELITVIVILGILMLIAIPSVSKHINNSKKETYVRTLNSMVDTVYYGILSGNSEYKLGNATEKTFSLLDIEVENGERKSPYGNFIREDSFVKVVKNDGKYSFFVQAKDTGGYCVSLTSINDLTKADIKTCDDEEDVLVEPAVYQSYSIGDIVSFAGSNWYVIKDSTSEEDYVTLLKEYNLTGIDTELGTYATGLTCSYEYITSGLYGCAEENQRVKTNEISYYDSDTCHASGVDGYTDYVTSGCSGHNDYSGSKVKEFLEGTYINTLGENKLKEINGYKIRLITLEELQANLGYSQTIKGSFVEHNHDITPTWVYQSSYFTMSSKAEDAEKMWRVNNSDGRIVDHLVYQSSGVRPVINLLKTSIEE